MKRTLLVLAMFLMCIGVNAQQKINGREYVDLGLSVKWATCNVGAKTPGDYGAYYTYEESLYIYWGGTWRTPTRLEFEELVHECTWTWTYQNGNRGYRVTGPNGNSIFLPAAGDRSGSSLRLAGELGNYWSSAPYGSNSNRAYYLYFDSSKQRVGDYGRGYGLSVRPVSE